MPVQNTPLTELFAVELDRQMKELADRLRKIANDMRATLESTEDLPGFLRSVSDFDLERFAETLDLELLDLESVEVESLPDVDRVVVAELRARGY